MKSLYIKSPSWDSPSGYAEFSRNLIIALYKKGVDIQFEQIHWWDNTICEITQRKKKILYELLNNRIDTNFIFHVCLLDQVQPAPDKYNISYTMFETDSICSQWVVAGNNHVDEIWLPSDFNKKTFSDAGLDVSKLHVFPLGVELRELDNAAEKIDDFGSNFEGGKKPYLFCASFQLLNRKNPETLIRCFLEAFAGKKDVALLLKVGGGDFSDFIKKEKKKMKLKYPRIYVNYQVLSEHKLNQLYYNCDAYISASYGEGCDIAALKMGYYKKPLILPMHTGYLQYANENNCFAIPVKKKIPAEIQVPYLDKYYNGQEWYEIDEKEFKKALKKCYREKPKNLGEKMSYVIKKNHSINHIADKVIRRLDEIEQDLFKYPPKRYENYYKDKPNVSMLIPSPNPSCGIFQTTIPLFNGYSDMHFCQLATLIFDQIVNHQKNIIHIQLEYGFFHPFRFLMLCRKIKEHGCKIVVTLHSYNPDAREYNRIIFENADKVVVHSQTIEGFVKEQWDDGTVTSIPMAFPPLEKPFELPHKKNKIIGYFGFSFRHKNIKAFIDGMRLLKDGDPTYFANVLAPLHPTPNPSTVHYANYLEQVNADKYIRYFDQFMPDYAVLNILKQCDAIVLPYEPTSWHGISAAIRTVARVRKPIVVSKSTFFSDLPIDAAHKIHGRVTEESIYKSVKSLMKNKKLCDRLVKSMTKFAEQNSYENIREEYSILYKDLI